jgi:F-type H+-transporting ATPase subunit b
MDLLIPSFGLIFWTLLAFLIVFFILKKFAWKPILGSLNNREKIIADSLATAEERAAMMKEARDTKDRIISEAKEQAKLDAGKIMADAQIAIEQQKMAALTEVKNQVGKLVIEVSEKILRRQLENKPEQENYIRQLAQEVKLN